MRYHRLRSVLDSISWLLLDRVLRVLVGVFVVAWTARYLGPDEFGDLNYAMSFVALFGPLATLGLNGIVVRDLVRQPSDEQSILGTAFALQLAGSAVALLLVTAMVAVVRPDAPLLVCMAAILGSCLVVQSGSVVKYWYEARVRSRYIVWIEQSAFLLCSAVRIALILRGAPVVWFAWAALLEAVLAMAGAAAVFSTQAHPPCTWRFSMVRAQQLAKDAWPIALAGLAAIIFMRIDQIMLGNMVSSSSVGIFASSVRIIEAMYLLPVIVTSALFPFMVAATGHDEARNGHFQTLYSTMFLMSFLMFIVMFACAAPLVRLLYGVGYEDAVAVVRTLSFSVVFVTFGLVNSRWLLVNDLQHYGLVWAICGALINVALNLVLIPRFQENGAALATVVSQLLSTTLLNGVSSRTRESLRMQVRSLRLEGLATLRTLHRTFRE
jgi:PST family polysaccharide transporter